jgi:hypothetical protein
MCILNTGHEYGNLEDTMDVVDDDGCGALLDTIKKFMYVYKSKGNLILNDNLYELSNPMFEVWRR